MSESTEEASTELSEHRTDLSVVRSFLANERTHLAYLRTSLSLMTFGITLNRFSAYLMEHSQVSESANPLQQTKHVGLGMLLLGILVLLWSVHRYRALQRGIKERKYTEVDRVITLSSLLMIVLAAGGAIWMILS